MAICTCDGLKPADYHCSRCHETFSTDANFRKHRTGKFGSTRHCLRGVEIGLVKNKYGRWGRPGDEGRIWTTGESA